MVYLSIRIKTYFSPLHQLIREPSELNAITLHHLLLSLLSECSWYAFSSYFQNKTEMKYYIILHIIKEH